MDTQALRSCLDRARTEPDPLKKAFLVAAVITQALKDYERPVVVGGVAMEFYTSGTYTTCDLDMITPLYEESVKRLEALGFSKLPGSRHWEYPELDLAVEFPTGPLAGSESRLAQVQVEGHKVLVIGLEDLLLDRIDSVKATSDLSSFEWAVRLMAARYSEVDWQYLHSEAASRGTLKEAVRVQREAKRILRRLDGEHS